MSKLVIDGRFEEINRTLSVGGMILNNFTVMQNMIFIQRLGSTEDDTHAHIVMATNQLVWSMFLLTSPPHLRVQVLLQKSKVNLLLTVRTFRTAFIGVVYGVNTTER